MAEDKIGAVMVVGSGIAGMQASLDLADAGFKVYLLEPQPAIGGHMSQLDKTFPTNDCAMCIMAPKLVETGRHLNIEILTQSDLLGLEGSAGHFTARVRRRPRYVDIEKCTGCGDCSAKCPITLPSQYDEGLAERKAIYRRYPQAIPNAFAIEKRGTSPCRDACPIHQRAQGYIALIRERRYEDAYRAIKEDNPFPGICGRACNHRCEEECSRNKVDEPINIMALKRFVVDTVTARGTRPPVEPVARTRQEKIAIIGSGPAGMTAAHDLVKLGYGATVFEALPVAGGMMRVGVPEYRLPAELIEQEIADILALGVELKLNHRIEDIEALLAEGYNAVFIATGAPQGRKLRIPGADHPDVLVSLDFLQQVRMGEKVKMKDRVLVLGGGDVAMDAARTALRLGAKEVTISCLECQDKMPAHAWELEEAEDEGIIMYPGRTFKEIVVEDGRIKGVRCVNVDFRGFAPDGRLDMTEFPETEHILECDQVIFAIGQGPDLSFVKEGSSIARNRRGFPELNPDTMMTTRAGVFAGGDVVTGTVSIVGAIAAGHQVARSIDRYLRGEKEGTPEPILAPVVELTEEEIAAKLASGETAKRKRAIIPMCVPDERVEDFREVCLTLTEEEAVAEAERCLRCGICSECLECVYACKANAVIHEDLEQIEEIPVGAVILAPGYENFNPDIRPELGYGRYPNVITSMQFERILSASGPFGGHVKRPSDGKKPIKVAWLQCVGSRDREHNYCSSVCCMYATKEAIIAKEHEPDIQPHIFMMDMRAFGKGYMDYYNRARKEYGIQYTRCRISAITEDPQTHDLDIRYETESGDLATERFDLVVLSTGMEVSASVKALADNLGLERNQDGFCYTMPFAPLKTSRPGVFVCGPFSEPKDIPETVTQASAAASQAAALLANVRGTLVKPKEYPPERDISKEEPRIGVFVCNCGINIGGVVNVPKVVEYAKSLPGVAYAEHNLYTCSQDTQARIRETIEELGLNRVIVASCTPRTHEPLFRETIREVGLNPYLFEMANIRDQCSWVHQRGPELATEKAKDLVRMAVARARLLEPLHTVDLPLTHEALVIGGGIAGMNAALSLAEQGYDVCLIEKEKELGGNARRIYYDLDGKDVQAYLRDLIASIESNRRITVLKETTLLETSGFVGNFTSRLQTKDGERTLQHGVTIVATGAQEYRGNDYLLGQDPRIVTQHDLEELVVHGDPVIAEANEIVMIQCVGPANQYCSRICCSAALKNALKIKEINPKVNVYILYKDLRAYGFREQYYTAAREKGVVFLRYDDDNLPQVSADGDVTVQVHEPLLNRGIRFHPDLLVLSEGIVPAEGARELAAALKVPLTLDGFFLEAHVKLRPVDFASEGVFLCGLAHSPKSIEESIAQAQAAASRAATILARERLSVGGVVAVVDQSKCVGCLTCVRVCPYDVPKVNQEAKGVGSISGAVEIEVARCQGCGTCVSECPAKAIQLLHYRDDQILAKIEAVCAEEYA